MIIIIILRFHSNDGNSLPYCVAKLINAKKHRKVIKQ